MSALGEKERAFSAWLSAQLDGLGLDVDVYLDYVCDTHGESYGIATEGIFSGAPTFDAAA